MVSRIIVVLILPSIVQCFECSEEFRNDTRTVQKDVDYDGFRSYEYVDEAFVLNSTILCSHFNELTGEIFRDQNYQPQIYEQFLRIQDSNISTLPASVFSKFTTITKLYLRNIHLRLILPEAFDNLRTLRQLDLADNELTEVSKGVFSSLHSLEILDLSNNQIRTIEDFAFMGLDSLKRIFLKKNHLSEINVKVFQGVKQLEILELSNNQIRIIEDVAFMELHNLREIFLSSNQLGEIDVKMFQKVQKLEMVDLSNNRIRTIDDFAFVGLDNLNEVYLNRNQLGDIDGKIFQGMNKLDVLDLSQNAVENFSLDHMSIRILNLSSNGLHVIDFHKFPKCVNADLSQNTISLVDHLEHVKFTNLDLSVNNLTRVNGTLGFVRILNISHNEIETLSLSFNRSTDLFEINLAFNHISSLEEGIFGGLSMLQSLDLSHNNLSVIHRALFHDLEILIFLNLSHNRIERFPFGTFNSVKNLMSLDISHNLLFELDYYTLMPMSRLNVLYFENNQISSFDVADLTNHFTTLRTISLADNAIWKCETLALIAHHLRQRRIEMLKGHRFDVENLDGVACNSQVSERGEINVHQSTERFVKEVDVKVKVNTSLDDSGFVKFFDSSYRKTNFFQYFDNFAGHKISKDDGVHRDHLISVERPTVDYGMFIVILLFLIFVLLSIFVAISVLIFMKFRHTRQVTFTQRNLLEL